jgi:hypothetical protein
MEGRSRGPNIHSGGTQDIAEPVPPYEGRSTGSEDISKRAKTDHDAGPRETSEEEREGMSATDTSPADPHGVGESNAQGNEMGLGKSNEGRRKERQESTHTGVGRSAPIDPESPNLQPGDQGG